MKFKGGWKAYGSLLLLSILPTYYYFKREKIYRITEHVANKK